MINEFSAAPAAEAGLVEIPCLRAKAKSEHVWSENKYKMPLELS